MQAELERLILNNPIVFRCYASRTDETEWMRRAIIVLADQNHQLIEGQKHILQNSTWNPDVQREFAIRS